jgi:DNA-binding transcriptional ArsR family regulator
MANALSPRHADALSALADPTRRSIWASLGSASRTVGEIAADFPVSRPAVSQHLKVLREAGLVVETRVGTRHYFAVDAGSARALRDYFQSMWERALAGYAAHVEREERKRKRR